jgi:hypothetical protein
MPYCPGRDEAPGQNSGTSFLRLAEEKSKGGDPSRTPAVSDLVEVGTGQKCAVLPQEPHKALFVCVRLVILPPVRA